MAVDVYFALRLNENVFQTRWPSSFMPVMLFAGRMRHDDWNISMRPLLSCRILGACCTAGQQHDL